MDWKNDLKNPIQKIENSKIKVKLPHVNKKTLAKSNFCSNTVFSFKHRHVNIKWEHMRGVGDTGGGYFGSEEATAKVT